MNSHIRWLIRCDLLAVLAIEQESFEIPWTEADFLCLLRKRNSVGVVAERDKVVRGFLLYERYPEYVRLVNIAVDPAVRRQGVGRDILDHPQEDAFVLRYHRDKLTRDFVVANRIAHYFEGGTA